MALTYQALNGTVISKTITIQGFNPSSVGTSAFFSGIPTTGSNYQTLIFLGFSAPDTSISSFAVSSGTTVPTLSPTSVREYFIGGKRYGGYLSNVLCFRNFVYGNETGSAAGTLTVVSYTVGTEDLKTETFNISITLGKTNTYYSLKLPYDSTRIIVSLTFEPAE